MIITPFYICLVAKDEAKAGVVAAKAEEIMTGVTADLAHAMPMLNAAIAEVKKIEKKQISEVKSFLTPHPLVVLTIQAVCVLFGVKPVKIKDPEGGMKKINDYWGPGKKALLSNPAKLKDRLVSFKDEFDAGHISDKQIQQMQAICESTYFESIMTNFFTLLTSNLFRIFNHKDPEFEPSNVRSKSGAAGGLCTWVHAMCNYERVARVVAPKRAKLAQAQAELAAAMEVLVEKRAELVSTYCFFVLLTV